MARLTEQHGDAKLTDLLQDAHQLRESALRQHPRSVQGSIRRAGLIVPNPSAGKGAKAQKIGLERQARPLVRPRLSRLARGIGTQSATQSACGSPASPTRVPPVSLHKKGAGGRRAD